MTNDINIILSSSSCSQDKTVPVLTRLGTDTPEIISCIKIANKALASHINDEPSHRPDFWKDLAMSEMIKAEWLRSL
jgi:hypothetical protein